MNRWRTVEVSFTGTLLMTVLEGDFDLSDGAIRSLANDVLSMMEAVYAPGDIPPVIDAGVDEWIVPEGAPLRDVEIREVG